MISVIVVAFLPALLAPHNSTGQALRFFLPLLTGIIAGILIFFRLKDESNIDFDELGDQE
ncbi:MAG: hypothetical protein ABEJ87_01770 [Candidatus Nanohalobium sp.]